MATSPQQQGFRSRVRASFERQHLMKTIGAELVRVDSGEVEIALPYRVDLTQQHGFLHAGVIATILDSACGYAAFSKMPPDVAVLTVEYKINMLRPAQGVRMLARGRVLRSGKTLSVCEGEVLADAGSSEKVIATMLGTIIAVPERDDPRQ